MNLSRILVAVVAMIMTGLAGCAPGRASEEAWPRLDCGAPAEAGQQLRTLTVDGIERSYLINVPQESTGARLPMIMVFHGLGGDARSIAEQSRLAVLPAVVVFGQGTPTPLLSETAGSRAWQGAPYQTEVDDLAYVEQVVDEVTGEYCVDADQLFAVGFSNGGGLVALASCEQSPLFSAVVTVSGAYYPQSQMGCDGAPPMPLLAFHGTQDSVIAFEGGTRYDETLPGIEQWAREWAVERNHCQDSHEVEGPELAETIWTDCADQATVDLRRIIGGGHNWPRFGPGSPDPTQQIWEFFEQHRGR